MTGAQVIAALCGAGTVGLFLRWLDDWPWRLVLWMVAGSLALNLLLHWVGFPGLRGR